MKSDVGPSSAEPESAGDLLESGGGADAGLPGEPGASGAGASDIGDGSHDEESEVGATMADLGDEASMRERAYRICREYLHGAWGRVGPDDLTIKKVR